MALMKSRKTAARLHRLHCDEVWVTTDGQAHQHKRIFGRRLLLPLRCLLPAWTRRHWRGKIFKMETHDSSRRCRHPCKSGTFPQGPQSCTVHNGQYSSTARALSPQNAAAR